MISDKIAPITYAYIDPGTGSALIAILIGLFSVVVYGIKGFLIKLKSGIHIKSKDQEKKIPFVIYTDSKRYWNTFKPICDEFEKRKIKIKYLTQSQDDPAFNEKYKFVIPEFIGEGNKGITVMNYLNADIVLSTTPSLNIYQWKRSKKVKWYIHILHACNDLILYRMFGIDYYDAVLVNGQFQIDHIKQLEELRNLSHKECLPIGLVYFDQIKNRLKKIKKLKNKTPVILVAPSWGSSSLLNKYGSKLIDKLVDTGYRIIIRPHPQSFVSEKKTIQKLKNKYPCIEWNEDNDNFNILNESDILISDYSGIIFDYILVFGKPVLYFDVDYDDSANDSTWLDITPWTFKKLPLIATKINEENVDNIQKIIKNNIYKKPDKDMINKIKKECWVNAGKAATKIVDYMIEKERELRKHND